jgi:hypothetical protein
LSKLRTGQPCGTSDPTTLLFPSHASVAPKRKVTVRRPLKFRPRNSTSVRPDDFRRPLVPSSTSSEEISRYDHLFLPLTCFQIIFAKMCIQFRCARFRRRCCSREALRWHHPSDALCPWEKIAALASRNLPILCMGLGTDHGPSDSCPAGRAVNCRSRPNNNPRR